MENPIPLVIFQLKIRIDKKTRINMPKRMAIEHTIPAEETGTLSPNMMQYKNHGKGNPTVTSKIFEPTEDETAMSPKPFRATMTLVIRSGIEVPAAKKVRPITSGGIWKAFPVIVAHQTMRYENAAIHNILPMNVIAKNFLPDSFLVSGNVSHNGIIMGRKRT